MLFADAVFNVFTGVFHVTNFMLRKSGVLRKMFYMYIVHALFLQVS